MNYETLKEKLIDIIDDAYGHGMQVIDIRAALKCADILMETYSALDLVKTVNDMKKPDESTDI